VARWVARKVRGHGYTMVAVCTDITLNVDLTLAYERMAQTDRLTGIANRRGIEREIKHEMLRLRRYETPLAFAMFDIDHFKHVNDTHGHSVGDDVLREVARIIAGSLRDTDLVARWGGEEFLLVLPETTGEGARLCADRIRLAVAGAALPVPVTVSAGIHQASPGESLTEILNRTDKQLYQAKNSGRNRVC
jgi:diguanylate cyclase (GGDEF)-like protein